MTCGFQQCGTLASVHSDEPVQPSFKLRNSKLCLDSSLTVIEYSSDLQVAHATLLEISCRGSIIIVIFTILFGLAYNIHEVECKSNFTNLHQCCQSSFSE